MTDYNIKNAIKDLLPPILVKKYLGLNRYLSFSRKYSNWKEARRLSNGYDSDIVLDRVKEAMLKVANGEYAFARDSVLFASIQYSFPVLAGLLKAALSNDGELDVLDFGGALGSSYYQCRKFLEGVKKLRWNIVEQPKFVACGKQFFESKELKFHYNIEECLKSGKPQVALLSGVIQCVEKPYSLLDEIIGHKFKYLIFDRTSFVRKGSDRLAIQKVPANIYSCSYPIWFLNYDNFVARLLSKYELVLTFESSIDKVGEPLFFKGLILELKKE